MMLLKFIARAFIAFYCYTLVFSPNVAIRTKHLLLVTIRCLLRTLSLYEPIFSTQSLNDFIFICEINVICFIVIILHSHHCHPPFSFISMPMNGNAQNQIYKIISRTMALHWYQKIYFTYNLQFQIYWPKLHHSPIESRAFFLLWNTTTIWFACLIKWHKC